MKMENEIKEKELNGYMREILFRGKVRGNYNDYHSVTKDKGWLYGDLNQIGHAIYINGYNWRLRVEPETVGQFTGLKDKNGNKIFEGDIVKKHIHIYQNKYDSVSFGFIDSETYYEGHMFGEIVYSPHKGFCIKPIKYENSEDYESKYQSKGLTRIVRYRTEVVGNIHDNKENN